MLKFRVGSQSCLDTTVDDNESNATENREIKKSCSVLPHPNAKLLSSLNISLKRAISDRKLKLESTPTPRKPPYSLGKKSSRSCSSKMLTPSSLNCVVTSDLMISKITNTPDLKINTTANIQVLNTPDLKISQPEEDSMIDLGNQVEEGVEDYLDCSQIPATPSLRGSLSAGGQAIGTSGLEASQQSFVTPCLKISPSEDMPANTGDQEKRQDGETPVLRMLQPPSLNTTGQKANQGRLDTPGLKISYIASPNQSTGVYSESKVLLRETPQLKLTTKDVLTPGVSPKLGINCSTPLMLVSNPKATRNNCSTPKTEGANLSVTQENVHTKENMYSRENIYSTPCDDDTEREPTYQSLVQTLPCSKSRMDENGNEVILTNTLTEMKCLTKDDHDNTRHKTGLDYLTYLTPNRFLSPIDRSSFLRSQVKFEEEELTWKDMTTIILCLLSLVMNSEFFFNFPLYLMRWRGEGLIIYLIILLFIGLPLFIMEVLIGSSEKLSCLKVWSSMIPVMCGLGPALATASVFLAAKTCCVLSYTMMYLVSSLIFPLPWTRCDSWWTPDSRCFSTAEIHHFALNQSLLCILYDLAGEDCHSHNIPSHVQFWENYVLQTDHRGLRVLGSLGSPNINLLIISCITCFVLSLVTFLTRRTMMRMVSLFSVCTLVLLLSTSLWNIISHGALLKLKGYLTMVERGQMVDIDCYMEAFWLVVTGLNLINGSVVSFSSMLTKMKSVKLVSLTCVLLHVLFLVLVTITILPLVPSSLDTIEMVHKKEIGYFPLALLSLNLEDSVKTGVLTFLVYLTAAFTSVNLLLGLTSSFNLLREIRTIRSRRMWLMLLIFLTGFLVTLPLTFQAGPSLLTLFYVYGYKIPVYILSATLAVSVFWLYGCKRLATRTQGIFGNILLVAAWALKPAILIAIGCIYFLSGISIPEPYPLPAWAHNIGVFLSVCSLSQVIVGLLMSVMKWLRKGGSLVRAPTNIKTFEGFNNRSISELCEMRDHVKSNTYKSFDDILHPVNM